MSDFDSPSDLQFNRGLIADPRPSPALRMPRPGCSFAERSSRRSTEGCRTPASRRR